MLFCTSNCDLTYLFPAPIPIVLLNTESYITPNIVSLFERFRPNFTAFYEEKGFDWKRLSGTKVLEIGGLPTWGYINHIADKVAGDALDHNARANLAFSSYLFIDSAHHQFPGYVAYRDFMTETSLGLSVVPVNLTSKKPGFVKVPFVATYSGQLFKDKKS